MIVAAGASGAGAWWEGTMDDVEIFIIGEDGFDIRLSPALLARLRGEEDDNADAGEE